MSNAIAATPPKIIIAAKAFAIIRSIQKRGNAAVHGFGRTINI